MKHLLSIAALSALFLGGLASASASVLVPGQTAPPDLLASGSTATIVAAGGGIPVSSSPSNFTANYFDYVISDPNNVYCAGCYDFEWVFSIGGAGDVTEIEMSNFRSFPVDAGINTTANPDFNQSQSAAVRTGTQSSSILPVPTRYFQVKPLPS